MTKVKKKIKNKQLIVADFERLLDQQTQVILCAVDERLVKTEERLRLEFRSEINNLITTLDHFLKRLTDFDDEFKIVKARLSRVEKILQEKLGINIEDIWV